MAFDRGAATRELQLASLPDIQGSIQANDSKSSAALVVHGLLFAGVLSVARQLGGVFDEATLGAKIAGGLLLLFGAIAFAISVLALIDAVRPHDPKSTRDQIKGDYQGAFFPPADPEKRPPGGVRALDEQLVRLNALWTERQFEIEYAAEQIKLADIRVTQAYAAKKGFDWLKYELIFVGAFLVLVTCVAVETPHLARASSSRDLDLRWTITEGNRRIVPAAGGVVRVSGRRPVTLVVAASGRPARELELSGEAVGGCAGGRRAPKPSAVDPLRAVQRGSGTSARPLRATQIITPPRCGRRGRRTPQLRAVVHVRAAGGGGAATDRQLVIRAP